MTACRTRCCAQRGASTQCGRIATGKTLLAYGVMADIGGGFLMGSMRDSVHEWMLRTPWMIKRFVEGSGRKIYS